MPTLFPGSLDAFSTKIDGSSDVLAADTNNLQDAVSALQTKVGVNGSAVATSLDKRVSSLELRGLAAGDGQSWQPVTRTSGTDYQNTLGRTIAVNCTYNGRNGKSFVGPSTASYVQVGGGLGTATEDTSAKPVHSFLVPAGHYYRMSGNINNVRELY